jgi:hypothetical protein
MNPQPERSPERSFGVFKPVDHVLISFPTAGQADAAAQALQDIGVGAGAVRRYTDGEMLRQIDQDRQHASALASVGQEMNLVMAHRALAERGYHWLLVHAPDDAQARRVAEVAQRCGAERAQSYGAFVIEELIAHEDDTTQVGESPARGLDAQTPSGLEAERAERPPDAVPGGPSRGASGRGAA